MNKKPNSVKDKTGRDTVRGGKSYEKEKDFKQKKGRGKSSPRSTRPQKTDVTTGEPFEEFKTSQKGGNDAAWYARNPQLLQDSASFSYNAALGSKLGWSNNITPFTSQQQVTDNQYCPTLPGIFSIQYANFPGLSKESNSPINIAAENIYSYVRHTNSGHANYDAPDLMMYFMALDSLYSFIAWCRRIYGTARLFSQKNYYYQRGLTGMQGVDYDDLIAHLADFRVYINTLAAKASAFAVPATMPIMQRHFFMASNIYKDRDTQKSQLYIYQPVGFHIYQDTPDVVAPFKDAGACVFKPLKPWNTSTGTVLDATLSVSEIYAYGNQLISALLLSEDIGIMSGDVLKAFQGNIFTIPATPEDYTVMPVFDPEVLSQIQNSRCVPGAVKEFIHNNYATYWHALDLLQNPNTNKLMADFVSWTEAEGPVGFYDAGDILAAYDPIVSMNVESPTPADTMVATRLTSAWHLEKRDSSLSSSSTSLWECEAMGTEVVIDYKIAHMTALGNLVINTMNMYLAATSSSFGTTVIERITKISNFNNHPFVSMARISQATATQTIYPLGILGDVDTYRFMSAADLQKLNQTALLSQYGVPALGTY